MLPSKAPSHCLSIAEVREGAVHGAIICRRPSQCCDPTTASQSGLLSDCFSKLYADFAHASKTGTGF